MAVLKSTSSLLVAAAIAASLLALVSAAPLAKHRAARQAPTSASESMLSHVFAGLDVLYKVSVSGPVNTCMQLDLLYNYS